MKHAFPLETQDSCFDSFDSFTELVPKNIDKACARLSSLQCECSSTSVPTEPCWRETSSDEEWQARGSATGRMNCGSSAASTDDHDDLAQQRKVSRCQSLMLILAGIVLLCIPYFFIRSILTHATNPNSLNHRPAMAPDLSAEIGHPWSVAFSPPNPSEDLIIIQPTKTQLGHNPQPLAGASPNLKTCALGFKELIAGYYDCIFLPPEDPNRCGTIVWDHARSISDVVRERKSFALTGEACASSCRNNTACVGYCLLESGAGSACWLYSAMHGPITSSSMQPVQGEGSNSVSCTK